jgi:hypothetical protein
MCRTLCSIPGRQRPAECLIPPQNHESHHRKSTRCVPSTTQKSPSADHRPPTGSSDYLLPGATDTLSTPTTLPHPLAQFQDKIPADCRSSPQRGRNSTALGKSQRRPGFEVPPTTRKAQRTVTLSPRPLAGDRPRMRAAHPLPTAPQSTAIIPEPSPASQSRPAPKFFPPVSRNRVASAHRFAPPKRPSGAS